MKRMLLATAAALIATAASAQDSANVGIILGFTGPLASITPHMASGGELAFKEVSDSGKLLDGLKLAPVRADSTCIDAAAATAAAERLVTSDKVVAILGADCSGVTTAVATNVAVPNGIVMISPSATSPALSSLADNGFFFRTAPSDARQGEVLAQVLKDRGIDEVAVTYTNNDYGKGLAESFSKFFTEAGGKVATSQPHEDGKGDYSAEVAALAASGLTVMASDPEAAARLLQIISTLIGLAESTTAGDLATRADALRVVDALTAALEDALAAIEADEAATGYVAPPEIIAQARALVAQAQAYMLARSFGLAVERRVVLTEDRTPLDLAFELYAPESADDLEARLDDFIAHNRLMDAELFLIPRGREVRYYA